MARKSKKPRVKKSKEDSSLFNISNKRAGLTERIAKKELYKLPLGADIDFTTKSHLTDITFKIGKKKIYAGSDFLCLLSPYFRALLKGGFKESRRNVIKLKQYIKYDEFHEMLRCLSDPARQIKADVVESLLFLADYYDIKWLVDRSEDFLISTNKFSVSQKLLLADRYRLVKLEVTCLHSLCDSRTKELMTDQVKNSEEYAELSKRSKDILNGMYIADGTEITETNKVENVEEPIDGFITVGTLAVQARLGDAVENSILNLAGLIWKLDIWPDVGETEFMVPDLIVNERQVSTVEWTKEGFVEVTMTAIDLENGQELRNMKKTFALDLNHYDKLVWPTGRMMERMLEDDDEFEAAREFVDLTIYITRTSGLRRSPSFDFTVPSELTDVAFIVEGRKVHVNRQYLAVISSRLFEMFYDSDEVEVKNVEYKEFLQFLQWIYPSQRRYLTASWMFSTLKIARQLGVEIDTSIIERYLSEKNVNVLYLERMIFWFEFNIGDRNKLKEGDWYGLREANYHDSPTKLTAAYVLLQECPLFAKMTPEKKNDLYQWILMEEYDL